ncbi:MAG: hypothetical protein Q7K42_02005, partial [Candidatus Diapherotrites archaeon]|nr:hypothetical protein [Candidatus Diapherotrites archaeon]
FKATDLIVVARPIKKKGSLRSVRRIVQITEVGKHWLEEPEKEKGLLDLMLYNSKTDQLEIVEENWKNSELFKKITTLSGLSYDQIIEEITLRGDSKMFLVDLKQKHRIPQFLEAEYTSAASTKLLLIREKYLQDYGKLNYVKVLEEWKNWITNNLLKKAMEEKHTKEKE